MKQIESFIRHWPRVFLLMLTGAIMGYAVWMYLPRHYIAITKLSVGSDYNRTGKLDDLEEDRLLGITEDIIHSDTVMNAVYLAQSSATDYRSFFRQTAITRTNQTWSLMISRIFTFILIADPVLYVFTTSKFMVIIQPV